jgi:hypothetical protein
MSSVHIGMKASSVNNFVGTLYKKEVQVRQAAEQGVRNVADFAFEMAQETAPVVSGALKSTGAVTNATDGDVIKEIISYGTSVTNPQGVPTADYAVDRHETYNPHKPETYKWLERAVRATGNDLYLSEVARLIGSALGSK